MLNRESRRGTSVPDAELVKNRAQMRMDGAAAEEERVSDLGVRHAARHQAQHLDLPVCQMIESCRFGHLRWRHLGRHFRGRFTPGGQNSTPCASSRPMSGRDSYYFFSLRSVAVSSHGCIGRTAYFELETASR